jgi:hypothetical protein
MGRYRRGTVALCWLVGCAAPGADVNVPDDVRDTDSAPADTETLPTGDTDPAVGETDVPPAETDTVIRALEFALPSGLGDDGASCVGTATCRLTFSYPNSRTLTLRYTEDAVPVAGRPVAFEVVDGTDLAGMATLSASDVVTDADGLATVAIGVLDGGTWQFSVRATTDGAPERLANVRTTVFNPVPLSVTTSYAGAQSLASFDVFLYEQVGGLPDCSDPLAITATLTADDAKSNVFWGQTARFTTFAGLEADGEQVYTVIARAAWPFDAGLSVGCNAVDGRVRWVAPTTVDIVLIDL